jgi:hypothetical protein
MASSGHVVVVAITSLLHADSDGVAMTTVVDAAGVQASWTVVPAVTGALGIWALVRMARRSAKYVHDCNIAKQGRRDLAFLKNDLYRAKFRRPLPSSAWVSGMQAATDALSRAPRDRCAAARNGT